MAKAPLPLPQPDDPTDDHFNLPSKKEKRIEPLHEIKASKTPKPPRPPKPTKVPKPPKERSTPEIPGASPELLEELRRKTAELTKRVKGPQQLKNRLFDLHTGSETKQIVKNIQQAGKQTEKARKSAHVEPLKPPAAEAAPTPPAKSTDPNPAVALVREKLARIYKKEPDAAEEAIEAYQAGGHRTKHQQFMYDLTTSGRSLADIQTEWHAYYISLPDKEKHEVWQEFYIGQNRPVATTQPVDQPAAKKRKMRTKPAKPAGIPTLTPHDTRNAGGIKHQILSRVNAGGKLTPAHHFKSLLFGVGMAALALLVTSFVFFNEAYIAPFISPSQSVSATPIIGAIDGPVEPDPKIIIPKINLEVPVVFDLGSVAEQDIQNALEDGVVHYASSPNPGENGNSVIVGHSSNNLLNSGKYKFAFVLLKRLEAEDTFFVHKDSVRYTYKIYDKKIVPPNDLSVLQTQSRPNTMTLITCDPPGTSINRLIIYAEQISPDPAGNTASTAPELEIPEDPLPSNAPSLWSRLWPF